MGSPQNHGFHPTALPQSWGGGYIWPSLKPTSLSKAHAKSFKPAPSPCPACKLNKLMTVTSTWINVRVMNLKPWCSVAGWPWATCWTSLISGFFLVKCMWWYFPFKYPVMGRREGMGVRGKFLFAEYLFARHGPLPTRVLVWWDFRSWVGLSYPSTHP